MPLSVVVSDTCSALNLLATDRALDLLQALDWTLVLHPEVKQEAKYLRGPPDEEGRPTRLACDWEPLERAGRVRAPSADELGPRFDDAFIDAAAFLTDVDAKAVALAGTLGAPLFSDDGKVRKIFHQLYPALELRATLAVLRGAAKPLRLGKVGVGALLNALRERARFAPPRNDPDRGWYETHLSRP